MLAKATNRTEIMNAERKKTIMLSTTKGKNGRNNYPEWGDFSRDTHGSTFGLLARVMKTHVEYVVPPVVEADYLPVADEDGQVRELRNDAIKRRNKLVHDLVAMWPNFFNALWATLATDSRIAVEAHAEFQLAYVPENPNILWRLIREVHHTDVIVGGNVAQVMLHRIALSNEFATLRQVPGVAIADFKNEFDRQLRNLEAVGVAAMGQQERAMTFLDKLDTCRHGAMQVSMTNNALLGMQYPATLQEAYDSARKWTSTVPAKTHGGDASSVFLTADEVDTALITEAAPVKGPAPPRKKPTGEAKGADGPVRRKYEEKRACHHCNVVGHLKRNCPSLRALLVAGEAEEEDEEDVYENSFGFMTAVLDDIDYDSDGEEIPGLVEDYDSDDDAEVSRVLAQVDTRVLFSPTEIVLDNAAGQSVFSNRSLLDGVLPLRHPRRLGGVNAGAGALVVAEEGTFSDLGRVGHSPNSAANLLSQAEQVDRGHTVRYDGEADTYSVTGEHNTWVFTRKLAANGARSRFYTHDIALVATVAENERRFTARELVQARRADVLLQRLGHMTSRAASELLNGGIVNCDVTTADLRNAESIHGKSVAALKGMTKKAKSSAASTSLLTPRVTQVQQVLSVDVFFIKELPFLLGVMSPLGLVQCSALRDRGVDATGAGLRMFLATAAGRNFDVLEVRCDGEGAVGALREGLLGVGVRVEVAGPGQHVPVVERMIETVKQRVRAHEHALPFVMPKILLTWCTLFCVRCVNLQRSRTATDRTSPLEQFSGIKLDAKRDLRIAFGDYVQATVPVTDNTMASRTLACIALLPVGNLTGSVKMWCVATDRIVSRDQFQIMPMPDLLIALINKMAAKEGYTRGAEPNFAPALDAAEPDDADNAAAAAPAPQMMPIDGRADAVQPEVVHDAAAPAGVMLPDHLDGEPADPHPPRRSARIAGLPAEDVAVLHASAPFQEELQRQLRRHAQWHDSAFAFHISVRAAMRERGEEARPVILKELEQMLRKGVWHGVRTTDLSPSERRAIIRSSMFLKDKYLASGAFEKFKARLVAGGDQQDKELYENLSSPTAATSSVMAVVALAAAERRHVVVIDIGGAFLNADMAPTRIKVHMRLDRIMTTMLVQIDPTYAQFTEPSGTMVVCLDKALYGCVEAAALWYHSLRQKLIANGFTENPYDPCVFNKTARGKQVTIALHVDDLLVTSACEECLKDFDAYLRTVYPETKVTAGPVVDYLGMTFDFRTSGQVKITMQNCVDDILAGCGVIATRSTPATDALFDVRDAPKASDAEAKRFHTFVAKLLYVAKRVRPDCLTAVAFLTTRVQACDTDDLGKLQRVLGYLKNTRERGIILRPGDKLRVAGYIDAAYGVHTASGRSHTGCVLVLGESGPIACRSTKQKLVTKSSTEAELVAISDCASQVLHLRNFIIAQGYKIGPAILFQDNLSCMALVQRGGPSSERSRHINIRYFWVRERVNSGELTVQHLGTKRMFANHLTKPTQGTQFQEERAELTNWK